MEFGAALEYMKNGMRVRRQGWNGKGMWLCYVNASQYDVIAQPLRRLDKVRLLPWIGMKTADDCFVPWLASQTDMLAFDWEVIE
jgi:hypothetical protein